MWNIKVGAGILFCCSCRLGDSKLSKIIAFLKWLIAVFLLHANFQILTSKFNSKVCDCNCSNILFRWPRCCQSYNVQNLQIHFNVSNVNSFLFKFCILNMNWIYITCLFPSLQWESGVVAIGYKKEGKTPYRNCSSIVKIKIS